MMPILNSNGEGQEGPLQMSVQIRRLLIPLIRFFLMATYYLLILLVVLLIGTAEKKVKTILRVL